MMAIERSEVRFGLTAIPYVVRRSQRRGTVSIAIDPSMGVLLTAPQATPIARLDRVVHDKARWIVERLRRGPVGAVRTPPREFVNGETFLYLGRQHRLKIVVGAATRVALTGGRLVVAAPVGSAAAVRKAVVAWYRHHAAERLPERAAIWAKKMGVPVPLVLIRDQRRRWGSCDPKGNLRFNWRIIQAPMRLVDYVVAHELVHLANRKHTAGFWAALGRVMPDYETRRERLRQVGRRFEW
jgi:predicted metal-dependent hydrolase